MPDIDKVWVSSEWSPAGEVWVMSLVWNVTGMAHNLTNLTAEQQQVIENDQRLFGEIKELCAQSERLQKVIAEIKTLDDINLIVPSKIYSDGSLVGRAAATDNIPLLQLLLQCSRVKLDFCASFVNASDKATEVLLSMSNADINAINKYWLTAFSMLARVIGNWDRIWKKLELIATDPRFDPSAHDQANVAHTILTSRGGFGGTNFTAPLRIKELMATRNPPFNVEKVDLTRFTEIQL